MQDENEAAIEVLLSKEEKLTDWEIEFLESISERDFLTEKQQAALDKIWERVMGG